MAKLVYKPGHVLADKDGWVNHTDYVDFNKLSMHDDKQATIGNQPIRTHYSSDEMVPTKHMADGKMYTSKSRFRRATKEAGCIEVGNETKSLLKHRKRIECSKQERIEYIKHAMHVLRQENPQWR